MKRKILLVILTLVLVASLMLVTACNNEEKEPSAIEKIYNLYVANAEEQGDTPLSYDEWLANIKGEKGNKGDKGDTGAAGNGIAKIEKTSSDGLIDTYTITFTDGSTTTFTITNGKDYTTDEPGASSGLAYILNKDGESYSVRNMGLCEDLDVVIPELHNGKPVTCINSDVFRNSEITSVTIPHSVTNIRENAFYYCESLVRINYNGTQDEWDAISKGKNWDYFTDLYNVYCTDVTFFSYPTPTLDCLDFTFKREDNSYAVSYKKGATQKNIVIPYKYNGLPVTEIQSYGFSDLGACDVVFPYTLEKISERAFCRSGLSQVNLPENLKTIEYGAFGLSTFSSIVIPDSVTSLDFNALSSLTYLEEIDLGDGITSIPTHAFMNNSKLKKVTMGDGITTIGDHAFYCCTSLSSVTFGNSLEVIDEYAFALCFSLKEELVFPDSLTHIINNAFEDCSWIPGIKFGDKLECIGEEAFYSCNSLNNLVLPSCIICEEAFAKCDGLSNLTLTDRTAIGKRAFADCTKLNNLVVPDNSSIDEGAFAGCTELSNITFNDNISPLHTSAFANCEKLVNVTLPKNLTQIFGSAFANCGLTSIVIPKSVVSLIYGNPFYGCKNLTSIAVEEGNTQYHSQDNCIIETASKTLVVACKNSIIPTDGSVTTIGSYACANLDIKTITIPVNVATIGVGAFSDCSELQDIIYLGTMEQWNAIAKLSNWNSGTGAYTIHCTDGDIAKS